MNLPNKLTISRMLMAPVFLLFAVPLPLGIPGQGAFHWAAGFLESYGRFVSDYGKFAAGLVFIIAFITDAADGYIARKHNLITDFGKFLDPIADKLLVTVALIALVERGELSSWVAAIIIFREFIVTGIRLIAASKAGVVIAAGTLGKLKTIAQFVAISLALFDNFPLSLIVRFPFHDVFMLLAVGLTIVSGAEYIYKNRELLKQ